MSTADETAIWDRLIRPRRNDLSPAAARALLKMDFDAVDKRRMTSLAKKAQAGALSPDEEAQLENYRRAGYLLDLIHSKARRSLR
jgi:hypothetical protein